MMQEELFTSEVDREEIELLDQQDRQFMIYRQVLLKISHDLRTPAAILNSNFQLLNDFQYNIDKNTKDESLRACQTALEEIIGFLDKIQLLNITLHPNLEPFFTTFRIKTLFYKLFKNDVLKQDKRRIKVYWDLKYPEIYSDYRFLQQILVQLLSNALKFSKRDVYLLVSNSPRNLMIAIKDLGIGIPAEDQTAVFNPFFRAKNAQGINGAGMGLALVRSLIKGLGAELLLSSKVDSGTIIKILLKNDGKELI